MKNVFSIMACLLLLTNATACTKQPVTKTPSTSSTNIVVEPAEDYFEWDGNTIVALSDLGAKQPEVVIPAECEAISNFIFATSLYENVVKRVVFESPSNCNISDMLSCSELESVVLPDNLTEIVDNMFSSCAGLQSIEIPAGVTRIGQFAFSDNKSLASVSFLGDSITSIGQYAFCGCESLREVTLPQSITEVGDSAFAGCVSMGSLTLPQSLRSVGALAFANCGLTDLYIPAEVVFETVYDTSFYQGTILNVHVVAGSWIDEHFEEVFIDDNYYRKVVM